MRRFTRTPREQKAIERIAIDTSVVVGHLTGLASYSSTKYFMRPHQLFRHLPRETSSGIFQFLRDEERDIYKSTLATLSVKRKLRPVFMQKRPVDKQIGWMIDTVQIRDVNDVAEQILQVWLMKSRKEILIGFLDGLGIEHDGEGAVEGDLPEELDPKKLKSSIEKLLADHPAEDVSIYLHIFDGQRPNGWPELKEILESDERLLLVKEEKEEPVAPAPAPAEAPNPASEPKAAEVPEKEEAPTEEPEEPEAEDEAASEEGKS